MEMMFLFWIAFALAVGVFANVRRNRNGFGWFVLAIIISPLLAGIFVAILRERATQVLVTR
jgi:cytochrome c oxidase subunit IV